MISEVTMRRTQEELREEVEARMDTAEENAVAALRELGWRMRLVEIPQIVEVRDSPTYIVVQLERKFA